MWLHAIWILHRHMCGDFKTLFLVSIFLSQDQKIPVLWRLEFQSISILLIFLFCGQYFTRFITSIFTRFNSQIGNFCSSLDSYDSWWFSIYEITVAWQKDPVLMTIWCATLKTPVVHHPFQTVYNINEWLSFVGDRPVPSVHVAISPFWGQQMVGLSASTFSQEWAEAVM